MLPKGQQRVWKALLRSLKLHGALPYPQELAEQLRLTRPTVRQHLAALEHKGLLQVETRGRGLPALVSFTLEGKLQAGIGIPLLGSIQAGPLNLATQEVRGLIHLPGKPGHFGLEIVGHSMAPWLNPEDLAIIKSEGLSYKGQVAVVQYEDEATFKRVYPKGRKLRLESVNPDYAPFVVYGDEVEIKAVYASHVGGELARELLEVIM